MLTALSPAHPAAAGAALLALRRNIFDFGSSIIKSSWSRKANSNPCSPRWAYILCAAGRVTSLRIPNMGIRAQGLPPELANMDALVWLDLSGNE